MNGSVGNASSGIRSAASLRHEVHAAAIELDQYPCSTRGPRRRAAGETRKPLCGFFDIGDGDDNVEQARRAVGMGQPARLPYSMLGMVGQHLDASFRHRARFEAGDGEGRRIRAGFGRDRPRHSDEFANCKIIGGETAVCRSALATAKAARCIPAWRSSAASNSRHKGVSAVLNNTSCNRARTSR